MKIMQTGDWHIGKLVHGIHMTEDQRYILKKLVMKVETEKPDVLIIAGDIYDRSIPPVEAVELLDEILSEIIIKYKTNIIVIAGNHDSPDRVGFASNILKDNGLYIIGNIEKEVAPIVINDEYGPVNFYAIPYIEPIIARELLKKSEIKSHDDAMREIINTIKIKENERNVCIAHAFVMGTEKPDTSDSERPLSIGGTESVSVEYFTKFDYVALGHLHRPQKVKEEYIRYSGSLLKYSFSEAVHKKSIPIVNLGKKGQIDIELIQLEYLRDMRIIKGELAELIKKEVYSETNTDDYILARLSDRGELIDPISQLRAIYPNILRLEKENFEREIGEEKTSASKGFVEKNPVQLFKEFYENISGEIFSDEKEQVISKIFDEINCERRNS